MSIEGATVYRSLRGEAEAATAAASQLNQASERIENEARALVEQKSGTLLELARHYLPEMSRPAVEQTMDGVRDELRSVLAKKEAAERALQRDQSAAEAELRDGESALDALTKRLDEKVREREALEGKVAEALKANPDFQKRSELAAKAEADLARDEQRVKDLVGEATRKLPAYDKSRLFRYLYDRGFGTEAYAHRGLTRSLDRWVARLIGFSNARLGYEFLKRTPELVQAEVGRRRGAFEGLMEQVEAIQKERADALGLTAVLEEGNALGKQRDQMVSALEAIRKRMVAIGQNIANLSSEQGQFYREAIARFHRFLEETGSAALEARARLTPEPRDDELVASVKQVEATVKRLAREQSELAEQKKHAVDWASRMQQILQRYRAQNFDSARSYFTDRFDLDASLGALRAGTLDESTFWSALAQNQRFRPHRVEGPAGAIGDMFSRPETRILIEAIGDAVNATMRDSARRGVQRRASTRSGSGGGGFGIPIDLPGWSGGITWGGGAGDGGDGGGGSWGGGGGGSSWGGGSSGGNSGGGGGGGGGSFTSGEGF